MLTVSEVLNHIRKNEYENAIYLYLPFSIILVLTLLFVYYDDIRMILFGYGLLIGKNKEKLTYEEIQYIRKIGINEYAKKIYKYKMEVIIYV